MPCWRKLGILEILLNSVRCERCSDCGFPFESLVMLDIKSILGRFKCFPSIFSSLNYFINSESSITSLDRRSLLPTKETSVGQVGHRLTREALKARSKKKEPCQSKPLLGRKILALKIQIPKKNFKGTIEKKTT
jgi:hypothetical protein